MIGNKRAAAAMILHGIAEEKPGSLFPQTRHVESVSAQATLQVGQTKAAEVSI
jgi:hypothetical protein